MIPKITPSLWFDRNCEEAVNFYVDVFKNAPHAKGESKIEMIKYYPPGITEGPMAGFDGQVLTEIFWLAGQRFMALDGGPVFKPTGAISMLVECEDQEEVDYYWDKLKEGGAPEAQVCGWLADKYGFAWQISPKQLGEMLSDKDKAKADRAMQAMLKMKKLDIAELEKAFKGNA
jgi:predicted 3-demethylubiquinone-9 3-methyltransferase (glyoxalase superfamily)